MGVDGALCHNGRETHIKDVWVQWMVEESAHENRSDLWEVVSSTRRGILYQALQPGVPIVPCVPSSLSRRQSLYEQWGTKDALPGGHLGDNLIGLIGSDVHLEGGGWLKQFPYTS
jgi:hypothetical protein